VSLDTPNSSMSVQQPHGIPQIDPTMMTSPRQRVSDLQRSDINQMSSGQLAKALGVIPEDRDAWNKLVIINSKVIEMLTDLDARHQSIETMDRDSLDK
jgi:hypothetical protein